ncbi:hypothetical protein Zmor_012241 [Zophobas morio]|uniref:Uncharacterized protein n=1 Tax=Zophobas morio TaxID=2755281 RepID=A0AA38HHC1_9CUCU|nr:hypothetical protein Zmor_012241 [Zophobas morio]
MMKIDYFDDTVTDYEIQSTQTFADITIELPGFKREHVQREAEVRDIMGFSDSFLEDVIEKPKPINYDYYGEEQNNFSNMRQSYPEQNMNQNLNSNSMYQDFNQQPQQQIMPQQIQQPQPYIQKNEEIDYNYLKDSDFPQGKFGNISVDKAREEFKKETILTPFGANGKTLEVLGKNKVEAQQKELIIDEPVAPQQKVSKKNDYVSDGQITLDEFMENTENHVAESQIPSYDSPLKRRVSRNDMNYD